MGELENEWRKFSSRYQKSKFDRHWRWRLRGRGYNVSFGCDFRHGDRRACLYFYDDAHYLGFKVPLLENFGVYTFTTILITAAKRREFRANFKRQIIENIVKKHALSYDKDRGLRLDEFLCRVDEWSSEDLVEAI